VGNGKDKTVAEDTVRKLENSTECQDVNTAKLHGDEHNL
jgi:hypothetical protein